MPLAAGVKLGPYEITAPLGAGGMGEVYRARDARLSRDVALKVLPASFSADPERLRRFEQEARATGLLNHPNILQVFDTGSHEGAPYVVSELLEGDTLRDRIGATALPVRKAIDYATQIARGLSAAHDKGIVHRDLKPENVFVTRDGRVKILDFGLAKLTSGEAMAEAETHTRGAPGTDAGKVLGTVGYMSPEQVRAQPVDHRSDIFSFGSVFYEMLSGRRAFRGASAIETMNAILKEDPPELSETSRNLPPALERLVSHCLEKNPEERFQSARDIAFDLEQLSGSAAQTALPVAAGAGGRRSLRLLGTLLAALALAAGSFVAGRRSAPPATSPEFVPITFQRGSVGRARFAPDDRTIVYSARWPGSPPNIYTAQAGNPESRALNLSDAVFSGVSRKGELAILLPKGPSTGRTLARLPMGGGAPRDVAERIVEADWTPDGSFAAITRGGGRDRIEFPLGKSVFEAAYLSNLRVSPRGDAVAFTNHPIAGDNRGEVAMLGAGGTKRSLSAGWSDIRGLAWSPDGSEVWFTATRAGIELNLWAVSLDGRVRQVFRAPGNLVIQDTAADGRVLLTVGRAKPSLFGLAPGESKERDLSWLDWGWPADLSADGKTFLFSEQGDAGGAEYSSYVRRTDGSAPVLLGKGAASALSPDGRFAVVLSVVAPQHLTLLPTGAGQARALPRGTVDQFQWAAFFPDGQRIAFLGNEAGKTTRLWVQDLSQGDPRPISAEGVSTTGGLLGADAISPDGRFVVAPHDEGPALYPVDGKGSPIPAKGGTPNDEPLAFSRDGRWLYVRVFALGQGLRLPARIERIELASGRREPWRELAPPGASSLGSINALVLAPDAGAYAYVYFESLTTLYEVRGLR